MSTNQATVAKAYKVTSAAGITYSAKRLTNGFATWWSIADHRGQNITCTAIGQEIRHTLEGRARQHAN